MAGGIDAVRAVSHHHERVPAVFAAVVPLFLALAFVPAEVIIGHG